MCINKRLLGVCVSVCECVCLRVFSGGLMNTNTTIIVQDSLRMHGLPVSRVVPEKGAARAGYVHECLLVQWFA